MRSTLLDVAKDEVVDLSELSRTGALHLQIQGEVVELDLRATA